MYPFRRILVPTDFSTASRWVFDESARVAARTGAEILILHIRMTWDSDPSELRFPADPALYEYAEKQELEKLREQLHALGAEIPTRMIVKDAPEIGREICRTAKEENADLIVVATHARHHVAHLLIGSTTLSVINDPPAPVLAIRYGTRKRETMQRMVVPVHPGQKSHGALDLAAAIAGKEGSEVHLLTVCGDNEWKAAHEHLTAIRRGIEGVRVATHVVEGNDVVKEIVRYANETNADVIFLNAEQQMSETKIEIIRHSSTPVMIVPVV
ncbi:MAG TPA: universal stress protein [Thermoanaerobaculia bacterium]|nr:universal stress protein [Thermoanaerobaculia bacterium]